MSAERYLTDVFSQLRYLATWLPNARLTVGDVGVSRAGIFERLTPLENLSVDYKTTRSKSPLAIEATSSSGVEISTHLAAEGNGVSALASGDAGMTIEFKASGCFEVSIDDRSLLKPAF